MPSRWRALAYEVGFPDLGFGSVNCQGWGDHLGTHAGGLRFAGRRSAGGAAGSSARVESVEEKLPGDRPNESDSGVSELGNEVPDGLAGIFWCSRPTQSSVEEQLEHVEGQESDEQDSDHGVGLVVKDVGQVPLLGQLVEGGVFDMPPAPMKLVEQAGG